MSKKVSSFLYIVFTLLPIWAYIHRKKYEALMIEEITREIRSKNSYYIQLDNSQPNQNTNNIDDDDGAGIVLGGGADITHFGDTDIVARDAPLRPKPDYPVIDKKLSEEAAKIDYSHFDAIAYHAKLRKEAALKIIDARDNKNFRHNSKNKPKQFFFPPECSWQCYLRHNYDIGNYVNFDESSALHHYWEFGQYDDRECTCKILLLAGPNQAEFTKLQTSAMAYSDMDKVPWKFITPISTSTNTTDTFHDAMTFNTAAAFDPLAAFNAAVKGLSSGKKTKRIENTFQDFVLSYFEVGNLTRVEFNTTYKSIFKEEIARYFEDGYSIVLGSDEVNRIIENGEDGLKFIDEVLSILPSRVIEEPDLFSTLVVYQSPRVNHLHKSYKESLTLQQEQHEDVNYNEGDNTEQTFHQFFNSSALVDQFRTMDSLKLTNVLVEKGLHVKLLDMSGVINYSNQTFFSILGCDIMDMKCELNKKEQYLPAALIHSDKKHSSKQFTTVSFARSSNISEVEGQGVEDNDLIEIDKSIKNYDCGFADTILKNENVTIVFGNDLISDMKKCEYYDVDSTELAELIVSMRKTLGYSLDLPSVPY